MQRPPIITFFFVSLLCTRMSFAIQILLRLTQPEPDRSTPPKSLIPGSRVQIPSAKSAIQDPHNLSRLETNPSARAVADLFVQKKRANTTTYLCEKRECRCDCAPKNNPFHFWKCTLSRGRCLQSAFSDFSFCCCSRL